jgi:hypothetical protein
VRLWPDGHQEIGRTDLLSTTAQGGSTSRSPMTEQVQFQVRDIEWR